MIDSHAPAAATFSGALLGSPDRRLFASHDLDETRAQVPPSGRCWPA